MELNAEQKLRTLAKLQKDEEAVVRKAQQMSRTAEDARTANRLKAQRVARHSQKVEQATEVNYQQILADDAARQAIVSHRKASEQQRASAVWETLEKNIQSSASTREAMRHAREGRIVRKMEEDEEKRIRKAHYLESVQAGARYANVQKSEKVAEHLRQFSESQEERARRIEAEDLARSSSILQFEDTRRQRLELVGNVRSSYIEEAARRREEMQQALEQRITEKMINDEEKLRRKAQNLEMQSQRCQIQSQIREERVQRVKSYDALIEQARRACEFY